MTTHPLFDPDIKWLTPQELGEKRVKEAADNLYKSTMHDKTGEKNPGFDPDYVVSKFKRRGVAKYARNK